MPMPAPPPAPSPFKPAPAPLAPPLPTHLRGMSPPDLEGEVIDTREIQGKAETDFAGNTVRFIFALILLPFQPLMVLAAWILGGRRPEERQVVYVVRVQRPDGAIGQARIERDILGATLDVGDYVSIWGKKQSGVLVVNRAYNHTVGAELAVRHKLGPLVNKIILAAIILFFVFICLLLSGF